MRISIVAIKGEAYMAIKYEVKDNGLLVCAMAYNTFTANDTIKYDKSIAKNGNVKPGYSLLFDGSSIIRFDINESDIETIIDALLLNPKNTPGRKVAIVFRPTLTHNLRVIFDSFSGEYKNVNLIFFNDL